MAKVFAALSGVYAYRLVDGMLTPVLIPAARDASGVLTAHVATRTVDRRTNRTIAGTILDDVDLNAAEYLTLDAVHRAGDKAETAVITGKPVDVERLTKRFQYQLAKLTPVTLAEIVLADWRVEKHDAHKAGFTLKQLYKAVRDYYTQ